MAKNQVAEQEAQFEEEYDDNQYEGLADSVDMASDSTSGFEIDSDVELSARQRNILRAAKYPFDKLSIGQSFHVPATEESPSPAKTLAGAVTNANLKYSHPDPSGETEAKTLSVYATDEAGKRLRNPDGSYQKTGEKVVHNVKRVSDRHFTIRSVGNDDPRGAGARVFRDI